MAKNIAEVVVGSGWGALAFCAERLAAGKEVIWLNRSAGLSRPVIPFFATEREAFTAGKISELIGIDAGELKSGNYLREFRNKAFRAPAWSEGGDDPLWEPERSFVSSRQFVLSLDTPSLERRLIEKLDAHPALKRDPIGGGTEILKVERVASGDPLWTLTFGSGEILHTPFIYYSGLLKNWAQIEGAPNVSKSVPGKGGDYYGLLQVGFTHSVAVGRELEEAFFCKESQNDLSRHIWGYFTDQGTKSCWSVVMSPSENEDNHEIAKKIRKIKQLIDKMFSGLESLKTHRSEVSRTILSEAVRFEESAIWVGKGKPTGQPVQLPGLNLVFEDWGPSGLFEQAAWVLAAGDSRTNAQSIKVNPPAESDISQSHGSSLERAARGEDVVHNP